MKKASDCSEANVLYPHEKLILTALKKKMSLHYYFSNDNLITKDHQVLLVSPIYLFGLNLGPLGYELFVIFSSVLTLKLCRKSNLKV